MRKTALLSVALACLGACSGSGGTSVRCVNDKDCPPGQQCVGGNCQLPEDPGPKLCSSSLDCAIGYECKEGFCVPRQPDEPEPGQDACCADGGDAGEDGGAGDAGGAADEDRRDFSSYQFYLAAGAGLPSGAAAQCVYDIRPPADSGPVLGEVQLKNGLRLSGIVSDKGAPLAKARVPLYLLCGDADDVVPFEENGAVVYERYQKLGGPVVLHIKRGLSHHPHGLDDPTPAVEFILKHLPQ